MGGSARVRPASAGAGGAGGPPRRSVLGQRAWLLTLLKPEHSRVAAMGRTQPGSSGGGGGGGLSRSASREAAKLKRAAKLETTL